MANYLFVALLPFCIAAVGCISAIVYLLTSQSKNDSESHSGCRHIWKELGDDNTGYSYRICLICGEAQAYNTNANSFDEFETCVSEYTKINRAGTKKMQRKIEKIRENING